MFKKHNKKLITSQLSRRDFLRLSGLTLASTALPLSLTQTSKTWNRPTKSTLRRQSTQTLRVAWEPPVTLDPHNLSADSEVALSNAIYDYLLDTNAGAQLEPRLAQSWSVSEDGLVYTLNLVQNATFHDGSPFTADDVVWSFDRLRDPNQSSAADFFNNIVSVEASDPYTVVFTLSNTAPDFLYNLTDNRASILKAGTEDVLNWNGTGPFKMVSFDAEDRAVMQRNDAYWNTEISGVGNLEFIYFGDPNASTTALRDGSVDLVLRMSTSVFESLQGDFKTVDIPTNGYNLVRLRHDRGLGTDPLIWRAFKHATNRELIYDLVASGFGALGQDTPIGPLYADYFDPSLTALEYNIDEAKRLLTEAGYPDGIDLELHVPNSGDRGELAEAFRASWQQAGIRVEINLRDENIYYSDVEDNWLEVDLGLTGWGSRPTPQQYLDLQLRSGAVWNESKFSDPELDELIDLAGSSLDPAARVQAYKDIQTLLIDRGPIIVPYFFPQFAAMKQSVDGVAVHPFAGRSDFRSAINEGE